MTQSPQYPDLLWLPPRSFTPGRRAGQPSKIVVHYTAGREGFGNVDVDGAHYCQTRTDGTSAHYFVDGDSVTHCVRTTDEAHTALEHGNDDGIHYELCGTAQTRAQWLDLVSRATIRNAARQMARDMARHGIPLRRLAGSQVRDRGARGICGHVDMTTGWPEDSGSHTDPGPQFPWDVLFADIAEAQGDDDVAFTPAHAAMLENLHRIVYEGKRTMDPQTHGNGIPNHWLGMVMQALDVDMDRVQAQVATVQSEVDGLEEGGAVLLAELQALPTGASEVDVDAVVNRLLAALPPAVLDALSARLTG